MSAPVVPESVTLDELEKASKAEEAPKPVDLGQVKLEGEAVPEQLRGKTAAEALAYTQRLEAALRVSEDARKQAQTMAELAAKQPIVAPPAPPAEPTPLTEAELAELHDKEPLKAIAYMQAQAIRAAEKNLESRLGPLFQGTAVSVEQQAREKYKEEFELFGQQISEIASSLPGGRTALANPQAWDDLVSLVRGRPGNIEKMFERRMARQSGQMQQQAQQQQQNDAGIVMQSATRAPMGRGSNEIDETERIIMRELGINDEKEWLKWRNV